MNAFRIVRAGDAALVVEFEARITYESGATGVLKRALTINDVE